ncbi:MAG TPA: histidine phosphatase family protein [Thermoanaerobaculia bacterium]|jgi:broad specificity phosphatase PhoE|nr:histidine phosphatase family protein [Thermoanaerobaculia bacterium]
MKRLVVTAILIAVANIANAQRVIILVRHAEKALDANEPGVPLSEAGRTRAARLAQMLAGAGVTAIYATETDRARQTAEPLAKALKLEVRTYSPRDAAGKLAPRLLLDRLKKEDPSGVVLVVGHQNTVPDLLAALGHAEKVEIGDKQFDDLFVVVQKATGPPTVVRLKY